MSHIMIDIETLGIKPGAVITEISLVFFDPSTTIALPNVGKKYYLDIQEQLKHGLKINEDTLKWRIEHGYNSEAKTPFICVRDLNNILCTSISTDDVLWAKAPSFDKVLLEALFNIFKLPIPWVYSQWQDVRTIQSYIDKSRIPFNSDLAHDSLYDCEYQIQLVYEFYKKYLEPTESNAKSKINFKGSQIDLDAPIKQAKGTYWPYMINRIKGGLANPTIVKKSWGGEKTYINDKDRYCMKQLYFTKGGSTSMHFHVNKHETMFVATGKIKIETIVNKKLNEVYLNEGEAFVVPPGLVHKIIAIESAVVIEASTYDCPEDSIRIG